MAELLPLKVYHFTLIHAYSYSHLLPFQLPPQHNPMLVIPCGHTVCRTCSKKTKYCCICGCPAQSTAENTGLQRIITDFQSQERAKREGTTLISIDFFRDQASGLKEGEVFLI